MNRFSPSSLDMPGLLWQKGGMGMPYLLLALFLPVAALHASGAGKGHAAQSPSPTPSSEVINQPLSVFDLKGSHGEIFRRVLQARLYHQGMWTLSDPSQTPVTAARTIASLKPTFVTGLLRIPDRGSLSNAEVDAFNAVRAAVLASAKGCRFDIVLNAGVEQTGALVVRRMKEISARVHPDSWTFHIAPDDSSLNPEVFEDGIAYAHSQGQMAGYDGPLSMIPEGVDYIVVRASELKVHHRQIEVLKDKHHVTLLVELPTATGGKSDPDCEAYIGKLSSSERCAAITSLAENQNSWGYRFAYPVFYPVEPDKHAFDATKESVLMVTIRALLARFN
ncbi:MAG: hypothetical protein RLZZ408_421 [Verrucomicrobiota bacterium]|jgi:hypothetical protein